MAPFPVDPSGGDGRGCARLGAGGTPALPGSLHPMTSSPQGHKMAEAFWCRLTLKEVHLSSCLFVFIRGSSSLTIGCVSSNDPHRQGGGPARGQTGVSQRVHVGFLRSRPPDTPQRTAGAASPGSAGVPPASCPLSPGSAGVPPAYLFLWPPLSFSAMLQAATLWAGTAAARPKESHGAVPG